jgi:hypothetical protein
VGRLIHYGEIDAQPVTSGVFPMKVFLSYAPTGQALAAELAERLADEGFTPWMADRELYPGDNWPLAIGKALETSDAMLALLSPDYVASPWNRREYGFALSSARYAWKLLPIVVTPSTEIPWILRKLAPIPAGNDLDETLALISTRLRVPLIVSPTPSGMRSTV